MKNTGIIYTSTEKTPTVLAELAGLLPPLTEEQLSALEADILQNGCYSPVIVNEELVIVDGHNRQALCEKHGIPYQMMVFHFDDTLEAMQWAVDTQKARRNLDMWELGKIALKLKPEVEARARARMGSRTDLPATLPEGYKPMETRQELADAVGIGERTMGKVIKIDEQAPQVVKDALDNKEITVNTGYNITRQVQDLPEEEREEAAEAALVTRKARKERQKGDEESGRRAKISQNFSRTYKTLIHLKATEEDVGCWVECCRMTPEEIQSNIAQTRDFIEKFTRIAELLEAKLPPECPAQ